MKNQKKAVNVIRIILYSVKLSFFADKMLFIAMSIISFVNLILTAVNVFVFAKMVDQIVETVQNPQTYTELIKCVIYYSSIIILSQILSILNGYINEQFFIKSEGYYQYILNEHIGKLPPLLYEDVNVIDAINKATNGLKQLKYFVFDIIQIITSVIPYITFMTIYMCKIDPVFILALVFSLVPALINLKKQFDIADNNEEELVKLKRYYTYYQSCINSKSFYKETRVLGLFDYFYKKYYEMAEKFTSVNIRNLTKSERKNILTNLTTVMGYSALFFLLIVKILQQSISIGEFSGIYNSFNYYFGVMQSMFSGFLMRIYRTLPLVNNYFKILEYPTDVEKDAALNTDFDIVLKNVSFKYPNNDNLTLNDINIEVKELESIAIVGENGAGKSTLAKVLTGVYAPTKGIRLSKSDAKKSALYQEYMKYGMTLDDNIRISDFASNADIRQFISGLGLPNEILEKHDSIYLSKDLGGVDLSLGQWQLLALARANYRTSNVILLDEPTAAIDPIHESEIYKMLLEIAHSKTAIIVTHRLGIARFVDRIIVMDHGRIIQQGTHQELIKAEGKYAEMWRKQAENYHK